MKVAGPSDMTLCKCSAAAYLADENPKRLHYSCSGRGRTEFT